MAAKKVTSRNDPVMTRVRELWTAKQAEGWTQQILGERMGYAPKSARKSVSQFLNVHDPKIGTLRRFATALEIKLADLLSKGKG